MANGIDIKIKYINPSIIINNSYKNAFIVFIFLVLQ